MQPARRYQPDAIIQRLPAALANQIAAGEVVERPASIVKELIENALDAGASQIDVQIRAGGLQLIRISDNGYGIRGDELELAVCPHATSKISSLDDLEQIASLGFRGEALASISSVARLELESRFTDATEAWRLVCADSDHRQELLPSAHPPGTTVSVSELFYNTPARRRFLRSERTEYRYIEDMIKRMALSRFDVGFSLKHNQREIFRLPKADQASQQQRRVERLCGKSFLSHALHVDYAIDGMRLWGWLGSAEASRSQSDLQYVYVNGRSIRDKLINHALRQAYQQRIYPGRHPAYVLYLELDPYKLDVNVHPTKHEVRFRDTRLVHDFLAHAVNQALSGDAEPNDLPAPANTAFYKPAEGNVPDAWQINEAQGQRVSGLPRQAAGATTSVSTPTRRIAATVQERYLLIEDESGLLIIDGRAVRREQLWRQFTSALQQPPLAARPLLIPQSISVSQLAMQRIEQQQNLLADFGFDLSPVSDTAVIVRQVPVIAEQSDFKELLPSLFDAWLARDESKQQDALLGALVEVISDHQVWTEAARQRLVRDALQWQPQEQPSQYWLRCDAVSLRRMFED